MKTAPEIVWLVGLLALALVVYGLARSARGPRARRRLEPGKRTAPTSPAQTIPSRDLAKTDDAEPQAVQPQRLGIIVRVPT